MTHPFLFPLSRREVPRGWNLRVAATVALIVSALATAPARVLAAPGDLDPTFGTGGIVTTRIGTRNHAAAAALVLQPDGKSVAAGTGFDGAVSGFALARYNEDGTLDATC